MRRRIYGRRSLFAGRLGSGIGPIGLLQVIMEIARRERGIRKPISVVFRLAERLAEASLFASNRLQLIPELEHPISR